MTKALPAVLRPSSPHREAALRRATPDNAPVPSEHIETVHGSVAFHPVWIPRTTTQHYVNGEHALNLRSPEIGAPSDCHPGSWSCPVDGVP